MAMRIRAHKAAVGDQQAEYRPEARSQKSAIEKYAPVMMVLVVVMAFGLGYLWSRVKYLEVGTGGSGTNQPAAGAAAAGNQAPAGKYKTLSEAVRDYAKSAGLNGDELMKCVDSGRKADVVEADYQEGTKLGVQGTPAFFVNGRFLGGAFPLGAFKELVDRELAGTGSDDYKSYKDTNLISAGSGQPPAFIAATKQVSVGSSAVRGGANAKVTIVEFSDFQCPYCSMGYGTLKQVFDAYGDKVRLVYKSFPLRAIHPLAQKAAEAWECAREQGQDKAWKLHDAMFEGQNDWARATL